MYKPNTITAGQSQIKTLITDHEDSLLQGCLILSRNGWCTVGGGFYSTQAKATTDSLPKAN